MTARIPHGTMKVTTARRKWEAVRQAAQDGDPAKMLDAVQVFEGIAETMFMAWEGAVIVKSLPCKRCGVAMKPGKAIGQTLVGGEPDFPGDANATTFSAGGPGVLIDCLKCPECGFSMSWGLAEEGTDR